MKPVSQFGAGLSVDAVGCSVGDAVVGESVGLSVGESVGLAVGESVGLAVGESVGQNGHFLH